MICKGGKDSELQIAYGINEVVMFGPMTVDIQHCKAVKMWWIPFATESYVSGTYPCREKKVKTRALI